MTRPTATPETAHAALAACKAPASADGNGIVLRDKIAADSINGGGTGAEIAASARVPVSVGQCVADKYDGKPESTGSKISAFFNRVADTASNMTAGIKSDLAVVGNAAVMGAVNGVTETRNAPDGTATLIQQRPAVVAAATAPSR